jgi:hypothetical protein
MRPVVHTFATLDRVNTDLSLDIRPSGLDKDAKSHFDIGVIHEI